MTVKEQGICFAKVVHFLAKLCAQEAERSMRIIKHLKR